MEKEALRKKYLSKRASLTIDDVKKASRVICEKLLNLPEIQVANTIAFYNPITNEPDLLSLIPDFLKQNKKVYFPRYESSKYVFTQVLDANNDFVKGKYGVLEPKKTNPGINLDTAKEIIDIWLVPGIVFDKRNHRIGFGKGYFDRFLNQAKGYKIGIGYSWQCIAKMPADKKDVQMDELILA
ncbi:5-formyltetrahydrofolate cyclo-ligase [Candidatus Margulisiibacteriota bacterium]